jgi:O-antigen/teichoic acid export membrane protein
VARYTVAVKVTNILSVGFLQPFASAWAGAAFPMARRPDAPITYTKLMGYALVVATLLAGIAILFGPALLRVFAGAGYGSVQPLLAWFFLPVMFRLLEYWSSLPLYLAYQTKWLGPLATVSAALCLLLDAALVPRFGALGAALAWSAGIAAGIAAMTLVGQRYYPLPWDLRTCAFAAGLWLAAMLMTRSCAWCSAERVLPASLAGSVLLAAACAVYFRWDVRTSRALFHGEAYAAD